MARIVNTLREKGAVKRTELAVTTGLSYDTLVKYLQWMNDRGFVRFDEEENIVLTPEGYLVYDRLVRWILEYVGRLRFPRL